MPDVITLAEQFSSRLDRQDAQELERIIRAYAGIQSRIQGEIDALALEINQGAIPTRAQVLKMARFKRLMAETEAELQKFQSFLGVEIGGMGREYIGKGLHDSQALMAAAVGDEPALVARFRALPPETVERLMGFLDPTGPLYARLELLAPHAAEMFRDAILENIALGRNPKTWAAAVTRALGVGLTDALRMARTVQLYAYREASRANYATNDHIVKAYEWYARLDGLVCPACLAMHGTIHDLNTTLNGHHNCRCSLIPVTILSPNGHSIQPGEEWLKAQPEADQRKLLGKGMYEAYKSGKFTLADVVKEHDDEVYGPMKTTRSLKDLLGNQ